ncbi:MAG: hypothetical protein GQE15_22925 [Archangiaceae bacterium]|nr:hypothetical protein [Archangiaceae bacterium]
MIDAALEPFGLLPIAFPLLVLCAVRAARLVLPHGSRTDRLAASAVLAMGLVHVNVGLLGTLGVLTANALLVLLGLEAVLLVGATFQRAGDGWRHDWSALWPALMLVAAVSGIAVAAARLLPVWQWDSLGYHLPFVNFVIQSHGFAEVPPDVRYISTYPHDIELGMIALRLMLPDDRLVDLAQLPYGLAGAALTAAIARRLGASVRNASLAGALWLTLPCVFLQLPTNYVDVGTAAALLGAVYFLVLERSLQLPPLLLGAVSLGLFLGGKPSAPLAATAIALFVIARGVRGRQLLPLAAFLLVTLVFGAETYLVMLARHGNPVWPVALHLGPVTLPGEFAVDQLLAAGAALPSAQGTTVERLMVSWLAVTTPPAFDMKLGGLGLPFLLALPIALVGLVRRRSLLVVFALVVAGLSPDPSLGRYVLGLGALVLALALGELSKLEGRWVTVAALAIASVSLAWSWPGLTGDGPALSTYWSLTDDQRRVAVGPHGRPTDYPPVWNVVDRGESIAFDETFEFPGLLWSPELHYPVHAVPATTANFDEWLDERRVRVLAVGPRRRAQLGSRWRRAFDCRSADCSVFVRTREAMSAR